MDYKLFGMIMDRRVMKELFKDGEQQGLVTEWYENGKKSLEMTFKDDKPDGLITSWYENEINPKDGIFRQYWSNGQLRI